MTSKITSNEPIDLSHLGGRKILEGVALEKGKEPVDLSHIGGKRIAQSRPDAPKEAKGNTE